jgi:hypothetical protein
VAAQVLDRSLRRPDEARAIAQGALRELKSLEATDDVTAMIGAVEAQLADLD